MNRVSFIAGLLPSIILVLPLGMLSLVAVGGVAGMIYWLLGGSP